MPGFDIPNAYSLRAAIRESNGDLRGADSDYAAATALYEKTAGDAHFLTLQNVGLHGMTLLEMGQRDRGLRMIEDIDGVAGEDARGEQYPRCGGRAARDGLRPRRQLRAVGSAARGGALAAWSAP